MDAMQQIQVKINNGYIIKVKKKGGLSPLEAAEKSQEIQDLLPALP